MIVLSVILPLSPFAPPHLPTRCFDEFYKWGPSFIPSKVEASFKTNPKNLTSGGGGQLKGKQKRKEGRERGKDATEFYNWGRYWLKGTVA